MSERRLPPVNLKSWLKQVDKDPNIPAEFKNGAQNQLKICNTSFSSGSVLKPTESLHLRVIWSKYFEVKDLRHLMVDDPKTGYTGYVSAGNMSLASHIYNTKRLLWQPYFDEVEMRSAEAMMSTSAPAVELSKNMAVPLESLRPSDECRNLYSALQFQCLVMKKAKEEDPTDEDLLRTFAVSKPGPEPDPKPAAMPHPSAVNKPITPHKFTGHGRKEHDTPTIGVHNTPEVMSYYPAPGGQFNKPAADETYVNTALILLLEGITVDVGVDFSSMDWLAARIPFKLSEEVTVRNSDTGEDNTRTRELMEARVDGYLCRSPSPFETTLNSAPLAIIETKPYTRSSAQSSIRRQEGAEMACWISQAGTSQTGLLRSSTSGRKRRLMVSQDRHEIYIIVAEYGTGYEQHIRPSSIILRGSTGFQQNTVQPGSSTTRSYTQTDSISAGTDSNTNRRDPRLLAGSPSYVGRVERKSIGVAAGPTSRQSQPTQAAPGKTEPQELEYTWAPDADDFLIMHEFGPFLTTDPGHMEVFIKRLIAFMLELRGPQARFVPRRPGPHFLLQRDQAGLPTPNQSSSNPKPTLKKSRSWSGMTEHEKLSANRRYQS